MRFFVLLSFLFYANLSFALGLGDAQLKSNLGERFLVTIDVIDLEPPIESSCFSAQDTADVPALRKAKVTLKHVNDKHQLTITSSDVIAEPIINLNVTFHCEPNLSREYVLLLDPAPLTSSENKTIDANNAAKEPAGIVNDNANLQTIANSPEKPKSKKRPKKKNAASLSAIDKKLLEAYTGKQNVSAANVSSNALSENHAAENKTSQTGIKKAASDKPFLVISSGSAKSNADKQNLSLRLATEIDFSRPEADFAPTATTDALDEVTVMANRLSHLEKQIATLQTRNAQLLSDAEKAKSENAKTDWLLIFEIGLGILLSLIAAEFLRRKLTNRRANDQDSWFETKRFDVDKPTSDSNQSKLFSKTSENLLEEDAEEASAFSNSSYSLVTSQSYISANKNTAPPEKEEHVSIIDDADVFIEHGRPALAIQLLQNHLSDSPAESPAVWLKLLNLISHEGTEAEYDAAVVECNKHFNIKAAKFGSTSEKDDSSIEDYPHIITRLEGVWGSPYAVGFLNDLINNKRSQPREGLNQGAFEDLFFLKNIAKNLEYANPSVYKTTSNSPTVTNPSIANTVFNDALFSDIDPVDAADISDEFISAETVQKNSLIDNTLEFEVAPKLESSGSSSQPVAFKKEVTKASFDIEAAPYLGDSAYEVSVIEDDEVTAPAFNLSPQPANPEIASTGFDNSFKVQEIDFSIPAEKVEYATTKKATDKNIDLEFSLDFPFENTPIEQSAAEDTTKKDQKENSVQSKPKAKTKAKPIANKAPESNEIEWDLPEISPKKDK